ncbi:MAG: lipopolysaccharide biosynthesis protein [Blastomonas sp.]|jgi:O-antigen/teichoic acid export membrane protein|uniref:lipopolysaccharide biosynthesis protein n=2 Tax=Sphingomonadaceae TaxID=41297 RepID=UPI0006B9E9B8|nr:MULTISPECIES: lipopolysaccharide biosynthesis protein [unclassified Blastomonas]AOG00050.1 polysaccharide biosynthesis family protein [Blastomonas sp. RAC04]MCO5792028.1 lipopolysaccharide biosynthesis protein [Blastomonas sp.]
MGRIARNLGLLMSGKTVAGLISLVYIALSARVLGVTDYGVLNLVHGFATFMGALIAFSGFHPIVTYGTQALHEQDMARLSRLLAFMTLLECALALIAISTTAAFAYPIGLALGWSSDTIAFAPLYSLAILATVRATPWGLLQIAGRFDLIAAHQAMMPLVRLTGTLLILAAGGGLQAFLIVWLVASVAEGLSMWAIAWWVCRIRGISLVLPGYETLSSAIAENPGILRFLTITNFDQTLREFAPKAIPLIIGWVSGAATAGLYALAIRIAAVLTQPPQLLGQAAYSVIQEQVAAGQIDRARRTINRAAWLVLLAGTVVAAIMSIGARQILALVAGPEFLAGAMLLVLVLAARAVAAATPLWSTALTSLERPGSSLQINLACNLLTLPLLPLLLSMAGTEGAGYHALIQAVAFAGLLWFATRQAITSTIKGAKDATAC